MSIWNGCFWLIVFLPNSYRYSLFSHNLDLAVEFFVFFDGNEATKIPTFITHIYLIQLDFTLDSIHNHLFEHLVKLSKRKIIDRTILNLILFSCFIFYKFEENWIYHKIRYSVETLLIGFFLKNMDALILKQ